MPETSAKTKYEQIKLEADAVGESVNGYSDMLPPLKFLILKWGLLAQWLYRTKYLQAILACPAILLPGHGHIFLFSNCPDTDSLCCQHPSCLFTDVNCCIMISVHLISTRTAIDSFR